MFRFIILFLFGILFSSFAVAGPQKALKKGFIGNDNGEKCWYTQEFKDDVVYFTEKHTQNIGVITFDEPDCMVNSGLGLDGNKMMVNNLVSKWYSHDDANFKTHAYDLYPTSRLQIKGQCMQSSTYPIIGVLLDYYVSNDSITKVVHGSSMGGCSE